MIMHSPELFDSLPPAVAQEIQDLYDQNEL